MWTGRKKNVICDFCTAFHIHLDLLFYESNLKRIWKLISYNFHNSIVRKCWVPFGLLKQNYQYFSKSSKAATRGVKFVKFLRKPFLQNTSGRLLLKVLRNLIYEAYWFCCLLICRDKNKTNFVNRSSWSVTKPHRQHNVMW